MLLSIFALLLFVMEMDKTKSPKKKKINQSTNTKKKKKKIKQSKKKTERKGLLTLRSFSSSIIIARIESLINTNPLPC
jgi:hypothetical protein